MKGVAPLNAERDIPLFVLLIWFKFTISHFLYFRILKNMLLKKRGWSWNRKVFWKSSIGHLLINRVNVSKIHNKVSLHFKKMRILMIYCVSTENLSPKRKGVYSCLINRAHLFHDTKRVSTDDLNGVTGPGGIQFFLRH